MTTARLPGARRSGIRVGTHCAAGSKDRRGRKRVSHPSGNSRQAAPGCALDLVNQSPAMRRNPAARPKGTRYLASAIQCSSALLPLGACSPSLTFANGHRHCSHDCGSQAPPAEVTHTTAPPGLLAPLTPPAESVSQRTTTSGVHWVPPRLRVAVGIKGYWVPN